ncbi:MAG: hypothetical protein ACRED9_10850 [Caulobacteraceae bacterium]
MGELLPIRAPRSVADAILLTNVAPTARHESMALRWIGAGMIEAAERFRRLQGRKHLPVLRAALAAHHAKQVAPARPSKVA